MHIREQAIRRRNGLFTRKRRNLKGKNLVNDPTPVKSAAPVRRRRSAPARAAVEAEDDRRTARAKRSRRNFIDPDHGLLLHKLAQAVEEDGPIATAEGGRLYHYADGTWKPDGEREVRQRTNELLGDRWRISHANNVVQHFAIRPPTFMGDPDNRYLNLPNGLLNWRTGELLSHDPAAGILPRLPVEWEPRATCPTIDSWLGQVLPPDCFDLAFELAGYCLYSGLPIHKAAMLLGEGRNGKGTFLRLLERLVGSVNVAHVVPQQLDTNRFMLAELDGKLANLVGDVDPGEFRATERFKQATGGDVMVAERKNGQPFHFRSMAFQICCFNRPPKTADTTVGFFSRWVVLPFDVGFFPDGLADSSIEEKMATELPGLLVRAVEGLRTVIGRGSFTTPSSVTEATASFRSIADQVRGFVAECFEAASGKSVRRTTVYERYTMWASANEFPELTRRDFYDRFRPAASDVLGRPIVDGKSKVEVFRGCRFKSVGGEP